MKEKKKEHPVNQRLLKQVFFRHLSAVLAFFCLFFVCASSLYSEEEGEKKPKRKWTDYFKSGRKERLSRESGGSSEKSEASNPEGMLDLIDSQTTNVMDYGSYRLNFRLYSDGGLQSHLSFGVFRRLNIGASWDIEKMIGHGNPSVNVPSLGIKFRVYDGSRILPSFAVGYDGQGRFFDKDADRYKERERGIYAVLGRELFFPGLEFHGGTNIANFKDGIVLGSLAVSYTIEQKVCIMTEFDNIRSAPENRLNAGIRFFPVSSLGIDFAVRHIDNKDNRERIVRINYVGTW